MFSINFERIWNVLKEFGKNFEGIDGAYQA